MGVVDPGIIASAGGKAGNIAANAAWREEPRLERYLVLTQKFE